MFWSNVSSGPPLFVASTTFVLMLLLQLHFASAASGNLFEGLSKEANFSKFSRMVEKDTFLALLYKSRSCTVFAPTNDAFNKYFHKENENSLDDYHTSVQVIDISKKDTIPTFVTTMFSTGPRLYLSSGPDYFDSKGRPVGKNFYVNNAKILKKREYEVSSIKQILYEVDEVSIPYSSVEMPTAWELLARPSIYKELGEGYDLRFFKGKVSDKLRELLDSKEGHNTFFFPKKISSYLRSQMDEGVVRGHVIKGKTLFLRPMANGTYHSVDQDDLKVELTSVKRYMTSESTNYIMANTYHSNGKHFLGVTSSKVVRGNVPVKNGVVHFIDSPLMLVDKSIRDYLSTVEKSGRLNKFEQKIAQFAEISSELNKPSQKTVFAPSNEAFEKIEKHLQESRNYNEELKNILKLHIVPNIAISSEKAKKRKNAKTVDGAREVYFDVMTKDHRRKLSIEGGGVNATAIVSDIGTSNGIIHIIDKVLGVPFLTVADKMRKDPSMKTTYQVGLYGDNWANKLRNPNNKYTVFVPSEAAWHNLSIIYPSEHKQLVRGFYPNLADKILDRHLLIGEALYLDDLRNLTRTQLKMARGIVNLSPHNRVTLEWEGVKAQIVRPDVQVVNGVIHVIDNILMQRRDLSINSANSLTSFYSLFLSFFFLFVFSHW